MRKTISRETLRSVVNTALLGATTQAERRAIAHIWEATTTRSGDAYRGFKYVRPGGHDESTDTIRQGGHYDETRRHYF